MTLQLTVEVVLTAVQGNIVTNFHVLGSVLKGLGPRAASRQQTPVKVARVTLLGALCCMKCDPAVQTLGCDARYVSHSTCFMFAHCDPLRISSQGRPASNDTVANAYSDPRPSSLH